MRHFRPLFLILAISVGLVISGVAYSANRFSLLTTDPNPVETDFHWIYGSKSLFQFEWQAGSEGQYTYRSLDGSTRRIVDHLIVEHFFGGIGLTDWFSVGVDMPVAWYNHFQDPDPVTAPGFGGNLDLGDPRLEMKLQALSRYRFPVGLAFIPFFQAPLGNDGHFMGDETFVGGGILVLDASLSRRILVGLNGGIEVKESINFNNVDVGLMTILMGAGASLKLNSKFDLSAEGIARTPWNNLFAEEAETPVEALGSLRWRSKKGLAVSGGGGAGIVYGVGAPRFRGFLRVAYAGSSAEHLKHLTDLENEKHKPEAPPEVEWAIVELKEKCPADPSTFDPKVHDPSCPKYYELSEIASLSLKCPSQSEDYDPNVHDPGCPKVYELKADLSSQDYATVYVLAASDIAGRCPSDPSQFNPQVHDASCQKFFELQEAVSLVARCPENPDDFDPEQHDPACNKVYTLKDDYTKGDVQAIYLLAQADIDQDGVLDIEDLCPREVGIPASHGCPEGIEFFKQGETIGTRFPIAFNFNSSKIAGDVAKGLSEVAEVLLNHPEIKKVRIEGHADIIGGDEVNARVSLGRAMMVKQFLEKCGVSSDRLRAVGMGSKQPIQSNKTAAGRRANRRATVLVLESVD